MSGFLLSCARNNCQNPIKYYCLCNRVPTYYCINHQDDNANRHTSCKSYNAFIDIRSKISEVQENIKCKIQEIDLGSKQLLKASTSIIELIQAQTQQGLTELRIIKKSLLASLFRLRFDTLIFHTQYDLINQKSRISTLHINEKIEKLLETARSIWSISPVELPHSVSLIFYKLESKEISFKEKLTILEALSINTKKITALKASRTLNLVLIGARNSKLKIVKLATLHNNQSIEDSGRETSKENSITAIEFVMSGRAAVIGTQTGEIKLFNLLNKAFISISNEGMRICDISVSQSGNFYAVSLFDCSLILFRQGSAYAKIKRNGINKNDLLIKITADENYVVNSIKNGCVVIYSILSKSEFALTRIESSPINSIEVSDVAPYVAICFAKAIEIYDYSDFNRIVCVTNYSMKKKIILASFTKANKSVCIIGYENYCEVFNFETNAIREVKSCLDLVYFLDYYPEIKNFAILFSQN